MDSGVRTVILHLTLAPWHLLGQGRKRLKPLPRAMRSKGAHDKPGGLLRKLATPVREAAAPARARQVRLRPLSSVTLLDRCTQGRVQQLCSGSGVTSSSALAGGVGSRRFPAHADIPKTSRDHPTPTFFGNRFFNQPCKGVLTVAAGPRGQGAPAWLGWPRASHQGTGSPGPGPPKCSPLCVSW